MRRSSTTAEDKLRCSINYKLQTKKNSKHKWINKKLNSVDENGQQKKSAAALNRKKIVDKEGKMTASILCPTINPYHHDYHNKYHSVSAASSLSQSMKYGGGGGGGGGGDAWLYGNLCVTPSIQQSHFQHFNDPAMALNKFQPLHVSPHSDYMIAATCSNSYKNTLMTSQKSFVASSSHNCDNLKRVQVFGTVRSKNKAAVNLYPMNKCLNTVNILYSHQAFNSDTVVKSNPKREPTTSTPVNKRYPSISENGFNKLSNGVSINRKRHSDELAAYRKSILECTINPYELVHDASVVDLADYDLTNEETDCTKVATTSTNSQKQSKISSSTIKKMIKSKLINISSQAVGNSVKIKSKVRSSSMQNKKQSSPSNRGVSVAGHTITMCNIFEQPHTLWHEDWITDPWLQDEPEYAASIENHMREQMPVRPPRKNSVKYSDTSEEDDICKSEPINSKNFNVLQNYENDSDILNGELTENYNIKSILKKRHEAVQSSPLLENTCLEIADKSADESCSNLDLPLKKQMVTIASSNPVDSNYMNELHSIDLFENSLPPVNIPKTMGAGILIDSNRKSGKTIYGDERQQKKKKSKKQVQFIEMEKEVSLVCSQVDNKIPPQPLHPPPQPLSTLPLPQSILALPQLPATKQILTTTESNAPTKTACELDDQDQNKVSKRLASSDRENPPKLSSIPLSVENNSISLSHVTTLSTNLTSNCCSTGLNDHSGISDCLHYVPKPIPHLHRTLSESISAFQPFATNPHFEEFKDTMRLKVRNKHLLKPNSIFQSNDNSKLTWTQNLQPTSTITYQLPSTVSSIKIKNHKTYDYSTAEPALDEQSVGTQSVKPEKQKLEIDERVKIVECIPPEFRNRADAIDHINQTFHSSLIQDQKDASYHTEVNGRPTVIKIKVGLHTMEGTASGAKEEIIQVTGYGCENRTIVTITSDSTMDKNVTDDPTLVTCRNDVANTLITSTVVPNTACLTESEEKSSSIIYRSDDTNIITINVGYHENCSTLESNCVLLRSPASATIPPNAINERQSMDESSGNENSISSDPKVPCSKTEKESMAKNCDGNDSQHQEQNSSNSSVHYMSCKINEKLTEDDVGLCSSPQIDLYSFNEPIYEEILERPPPLPLEPPPDKVEDIGIFIPPRSIFEGASKYDILRYLAGAKERCQIPEEPHPRFIIEENPECDQIESTSPTDYSTDLSSRASHLSNVSDSSDELVSFLMSNQQMLSSLKTNRSSIEIERNDSGVGSETGSSARIKWQHLQSEGLEDQLQICEDCELSIATSTTDSPTYAPLVCHKCSKKRVERREIITEIVETEEKYGRDLTIILDEFYKPMLVAGLLTPEQLSSIFLNVEELIEHNALMAEKLRDGYDIAIENGDEDLLTFDIGKIFIEAAPMLHAFEFYCTRQGNAALILAQQEKEKELLKIFLRVSQMENTVLRRMNLNSFLMVPVQRVTKYPLLLARLYKVTPEHHVLRRERLKDARHNIELHLEHINSLTKDNSSMKLWRRISMINSRRASGETDDITNIKLQKMAVEILEWGHDEVRFAMEGRLLYAQPTDFHWKRAGRTVKLILTNALLVTLGKPTVNYNPLHEGHMMFPQKNGIREASLLLIREKAGKYSLVRDPLCLDHCIIYCDNNFQEYFEIQEIPTKDTYIFKAEDEEKTQKWYRQLQYHSQGLGSWRRRRNALANIMINGMQIRS